MAARGEADTNHPDLVKLRDAIVKHQIALTKWHLVVDRVVTSGPDVLRVKNLLKDDQYHEAVLQTLLLWDCYGDQRENLLHVLNDYKLNALALNLQELGLLEGESNSESPNLPGLQNRHRNDTGCSILTSVYAHYVLGLHQAFCHEGASDTLSNLRMAKFHDLQSRGAICEYLSKLRYGYGIPVVPEGLQLQVAESISQMDSKKTRDAKVSRLLCWTSEPAKCINVLLLGRSQTGKSTIYETIVDPAKGTAGTGFSDTREPTRHCLIVTDGRSNEKYQLNIIDTPGLMEVRLDGEDRSDNELLKLVETKCVQENITTLNVVCFVSKAGQIHRMDIECFEAVKGWLGGKYAEASMLVMTHCDEYDDATLDEFEQHIQNHEISKPYFKYCKLGIVRFGAINVDCLDKLSEDVRHDWRQLRLKKIEPMRDNFLRKIISRADYALKVDDLQTLQDQRTTPIKRMGQDLNKERRGDSQARRGLKGCTQV